MSFRSTLVLALVAALLGGWIWWSDRSQRDEERAEKASKRVVELDRDSVTALELPTDDAGAARLVRDEDAWRLAEPIAFPADEGTVESILGTLEELDAEAVIEERPSDLAPFGLVGDAKRVRVERSEGEPIALTLGGSTPVGSERYVARGDVPDRLYTVAQWKLDALSHELVALRDKRITHLEVDDVTTVRVSDGNVPVVAAERVEDEEGARHWKLVEPFEADADSRRIRRLIEDVVFGRASSFVDEERAPGSLGLDPPAIVLELGAGDRSERLELGRSDEGTHARVVERDLTLSVPERLYDGVPLGLFAYRFKRVLDVDREAVKRIEVDFARDGEIYAFALEDGRWASERDDAEVDPGKLDDLLFEVQELDAVGLEEASLDPKLIGLDPPLVRVRLSDAGGAELAWLELGDPEVPAGMPARSSRGEQVWRVDNELARDVPLGLEAFRNRWLETPAEEADDAGAEPDSGAEVSPES